MERDPCLYIFCYNAPDMPAKSKTLTPLPLLSDDVPYFDLVKRKEDEMPSWDLESEGELALDVLETPREVIVRSAIAGVRPEDISIHVAQDALTIRGRREACESYPFAQTHVEECHWGSFSRTIILPCNIRMDEVLATMKHGVLTITLPKLEASSDIEVLSTD